MTSAKYLLKHVFSCCAAFAISGVLIVPAGAAESVLYTFRGEQDGSGPLGTLIRDRAGILYGTTSEGGSKGCRGYGCGTVFQIAPDGTERTLHVFAGGCDGANPLSGLVTEKVGNRYGTTQNGGICNNDIGYGTVYKITPNGKESVFYSFKGGEDGKNPVGGLAIDDSGNLYGTAGGGQSGSGVVFKLSPKGRFSLLYSFQGGSDGALPYGGLIRDQAGNLYGTTVRGGGTGCGGYGCGTVFKLAPEGTETVLYVFRGDSDGAEPWSGVTADSEGNLYGTTISSNEFGGPGTVFKLTPQGTFSTLYAFQGGADGADPQGGVILDRKGNLYGTTAGGGDTAVKGCKDYDGCGVVFKLTPDGKEAVLQTFDQRPLGRHPFAGLLLGKHGDLYGTTSDGGRKSNAGVVFELTNN